MTMIIYKITNNINGKCYIGKTVGTLEARWKRHMRPSSKCIYLKNAIQKYGAVNFNIEVIAIAASIDELNTLEKSLILQLKPAYNLRAGGDGGALFGDALLRMRKNVSKALKGKPKPPRSKEHASRIAKTLTGKFNFKKRKPIKCSNGQTYSGIRDAAVQLNISAGNIHSVLTGHRKSAGGYTFGYI